MDATVDAANPTQPLERGMRMVCAWCREEGEPLLPEGQPPLDNEQATYGICASHRLELAVQRYLRTLTRVLR